MYSHAMVRPLAATLVPVMLGVLASVLAGQRIWPYVLWASAAAAAGAWVWARFQLSRTPAEVCVQPHRAAVRSVRDVLHETPPDWQPLVRVRPERVPAALRLDLGDQTHRLLARHWPRPDALEEALQRATRRRTHSR